MRCPKCGGKTGVIYVAKFKGETARMRRCKECGEKTYTSETVISEEEGRAALTAANVRWRMKKDGIIV